MKNKQSLDEYLVTLDVNNKQKRYWVHADNCSEAIDEAKKIATERYGDDVCIWLVRVEMGAQHE